MFDHFHHLWQLESDESWEVLRDRNTYMIHLGLCPISADVAPEGSGIAEGFAAVK